MTNWVAIPTHCLKHILRDCLLSVQRQDVPVNIIVFDNAATDGTREMLRADFPDIFVMHSTQMMSVAYTWNRMCEFAYSKSAEDVLVLNDDVELRPDFFRHLQADDRDFVTGVGIYPPEWHKQGLKISPLNLTQNPHPAFSAFLLRKRVWDKVGGFDERCIGGYAEDSFFHLKLHRAGLSSGSLNVPFLHYASLTSAYMTPEEREQLSKCADHNRALFVAEHGCAIGSPGYYALFNHGAPEPVREPEKRYEFS